MLIPNYAHHKIKTICCIKCIVRKNQPQTPYLELAFSMLFSLFRNRKTMYMEATLTVHWQQIPRTFDSSASAERSYSASLVYRHGPDYLGHARPLDAGLRTYAIHHVSFASIWGGNVEVISRLGECHD